MKRFLTVLFLCLLALAPAARADGPDDQYVAIYSLIEQGNALAEKGKNAVALARYREAESALKLFQANYPDWNIKVVHFRLNYLSSKITQLSAQPDVVAPKVAAPTVKVPSNPPTVVLINTPPPAGANVPAPKPAESPAPEATQPPPSVPMPAPVPATTDSDRQIKDLQARIQNLETDKATLQAKLKEALAAQPATVDPQELARVQEQLKSLQKENELLKASLAEAKTSAARTTVASPVKVQQDLAEARQKVSQLTEANAALALENQALQNRVKAGFASDQNVSALRDENTILKKQLSELQNHSNSGSTADQLNQKLKEAQTQLAALQSDKEILRLEKIALEGRVKQLTNGSASTPAPSSPPVAIAAPVTSTNPPMLDSVTAAKIAQLEAQRDQLQLSLDAATRDAQGNKKGRETAARIDEMTRELAALRGRIDVLEAHPVAYSPTELALMNQSNTTLMAAVHVKKPARELPAAAAVLQAEAQRYFVAHELDKAEAKYLEVLKLDDKNVVTLADLATIELELGHLDNAEKYTRAALAVDPNDDYSVFVLGQLKFRQKNYDEALDALSRAAQLNPQNARIQNFLGLTLSEKGLRGPAETAFRKAIQFDPGFADAHINLSVVYITQQPPLAELARWHYQKALAAGHPANADLEKLLNAGGANAGSSH